MAKVVMFNSVSIDGFFADAAGNMNWAHNPTPDPAWNAFVEGNAGGGGRLLFGRITYDMMSSFWPTPMAMQQMPKVAERMNNMPKVVFSRTLKNAAWNNTLLVGSDLADAVRRMKQETGPDMAILGSGSIVAQLTRERLIDEYQIVITPVMLGTGRSLFGELPELRRLELKGTRSFANGNVVLTYTDRS